MKTPLDKYTPSVNIAIEQTDKGCQMTASMNHRQLAWTIFEAIFALIGNIDDAGCDWLTDDEGCIYINDSDWFVVQNKEAAALVDAVNVIRYGQLLKV